MQIAVIQILIYCTLTLSALAQSVHPIVVHLTDSTATWPQDIMSSTDKSMEYTAQQVRTQLQQKGYPYASVDSMWMADSSYHMTLYMGQRVASMQVHYELDSVAQSLLSIKPQYQTDASQAQNLLDSLGNQSISTLSEEGYILATTRMDSFLYKKNELHIYNSIRSYKRLKLDSIHQTGKLDINYLLLQRLTGVSEVQFFRPSLLSEIEENLKNYEFIKIVSAPLIDITNESVDINLELDNNNVNQADVVIGFQPNDTETGKMLITGKADLRLINTFGRAETIAVSWQQLQVQSPRLNAEFRLPYILNSNFGASVELDYFKKDSSFRTLHTGISGDFSFAPRHFFSLYFQSDESRLISVDSNKIMASDFRLDFIDYNKKSYGLKYHRSKSDRIINPRRGYGINLDLASRTRKVLANQQIAALQSPSGKSYSEIYDSLNTDKWQGSVGLSLERYNPVGKQFVWYNRLEGKYLLGKSLFKNEMLQIGGLLTLRGYDEQSLFVQKYSMWLTEWRYILGANGYLSAFVNTAYVDRYYSTGNEQEFKTGFGAGLSIFTAAGNFSLYYALGTNAQNKVELRNGKIHIGYISKF